MDIPRIAGPLPTPSDISVASAPVQAASAANAVATAAQASGNTATETSPAPEKLAQAVKQVNDGFAQRGQNLYAVFEKDKTTGIDVVKIMDSKTHKTVTQLPPKAVLAFAQTLELQQGKGKLLNAYG